MEFISFIINNFWLIFLILVFLFNDKYFLCGLTLIAIPCILNYEPTWAIIVVVLVGVFTSFLDPYNIWKKRFDKKVKKIEEKYEADLNWYEKELTKTEKRVEELKKELASKE